MELRAAVEAAPRDRLSDLSKALWQAFSAGALAETEAEEISNLIEARKAAGNAGANLALASAQASAGQLVAKMAMSRKPQRPPVRSVAIERRRRWAAAGRMPPKIASHFTLGEQAALAVVAVEVAKRSTCMLAVGAIAALAGVSETTVRRALRQAKVLGFVTVEERRLSRFRNETNVVSIISNAWASWLRLARQEGGCQSWKGTNTSDLTKDRQRPSQASQRAAGEQGRARGAPSQDSGAGPSRREV
jgi:Bacterial regulatory proteins, gntR family